MEKPLHVVITHTHRQAVELFEQALNTHRRGQPVMKANRLRLRLAGPDRTTQWVPAAGLIEQVREQAVSTWEAVDGVRLSAEVQAYLARVSLSSQPG
ncbi:MAG TPA: hypothetical protein VF062_22305 [Candidatus Limnocylindrales bacterium]